MSIELRRRIGKVGDEEFRGGQREYFIGISNKFHQYQIIRSVQPNSLELLTLINTLLNSQMTLCPHIKQVEKNIVEKSILNTIKKCNNDHPTVSPYLCLICPSSIFCNQLSESNNCLNKHISQTNHPLYLILQTGFIVCKDCTNDFEDMLNQYKGDDQIQLKKSKGFYGFIRKCWLARKEQEMVIEEEDQKLSFGLVNLGNTCFFNSVVQAICLDSYAGKVRELDFQCKLKHSPVGKDMELYYDEVLERDEGEWIVVNKKKTPATKYQHKAINDNSINKEYQKLLLNAFGTPIYNPSSVFQSVARIYPLFKQYKQQDAQEFLRIFFDALKQGELKSIDFNLERYRKVEQLIGMRKLSIVDKYYGCYLASKLVCVPCSQVNWTLDLALDFTVEINSKEAKCDISDEGIVKGSQLKYFQDLAYPNSNQKSLPEILKGFFNYESLTTYKCPKCSLSNAVRKFFIVEPPLILTIVLKRFKSNMAKDSTFVPFEEFIDISRCTLKSTDPYTSTKYSYRLTSVIVHIGGSGDYGHYVCYRKQNGNWLYFSDQEVRPTSWQKVKTSTAYILFYTLI